jgi:hypothetical protein
MPIWFNLKFKYKILSKDLHIVNYHQPPECGNKILNNKFTNDQIKPQR